MDDTLGLALFLLNDQESGYGMYMTAAIELFGRIQNGLLDQVRNMADIVPELNFMYVHNASQLPIQKA